MGEGDEAIIKGDAINMWKKIKNEKSYSISLIIMIAVVIGSIIMQVWPMLIPGIFAMAFLLYKVCSAEIKGTNKAVKKG